MSTSLLGQNSLRFLYYRYKDSPYYSLGFAGVVLLVSLILFFQIIIPQLQNWFSLRNEISATQNRITTIKNNISQMNNIDKAVLNNQVTVAMDALPTERDFGPIINALSDATIQSGVSLDDFNFQIGDTSSSASGKLTNKPKEELSIVTLSVIVVGNASQVGSFIKEIGQKLPLSDLELVEGDSVSTTIKIHFYQKELPRIVFRDDEPLPKLSTKQLELINTLSQWQVVSSEESFETSSGSGIPLF